MTLVASTLAADTAVDGVVLPLGVVLVGDHHCRAATLGTGGCQVDVHRSSLRSTNGPQTGVFGHLTDVGLFSFGKAANKYGSQPGHPFVVRPGQLDVALRVHHRGVPQPLL